MNILIIGGDYNPEANYHYSDIKTVQLALAFYDLGHSVTMPLESDHHDNPCIQKVAFADIDPYCYHLILFTRENFIKSFCDKYPVVYNICHRKIERVGGFPIICARYGRHLWYRGIYPYAQEFYEAFDYHFPQEYSFCRRFVLDLDGDSIDYKNIWPSNMACPKEIKVSGNSPFDTGKKNLLYIGRLRHNPSRYSFLKDFMKKLGPDYRLNIIPGSFNKSDDDTTKFNPRDGKEWLVTEFRSQNNIHVLDPVKWGLHWSYLYYADYGLDFASSIRSNGGGNAKLVEYMRMGLPTVTEPSVSNSNLIHLCKGGVIARTTANLDDYISAFKSLESQSWDRNEISKIMNAMNNWEVRANELLNYISMVEDYNFNSL